MDYIQAEQEMFYRARIGTIYGCFRVERVEYDWEMRRQVWTLKCIYCGEEKQTHNGKDYVKGKNKGICKCRHTKTPPPKIAQKIKRPKLRDHELYRRWEGIKRRCNNPRDKDYHNYGARGIKMCEEWERDFMSFVSWAEQNGYEKGLTIDRIDNDKGYCPENCRWVPREYQNKNKRNIKLYNGETVPDFCKRTGLNYAVINGRMRDGCTFDEAVADAVMYKIDKDFVRKCTENGVKKETVLARIQRGIPPETAIKKYGAFGVEIEGETKRLREWCKIYGITDVAVNYRVKKMGMSYQDAITTPKAPGAKNK